MNKQYIEWVISKKYKGKTLLFFLKEKLNLSNKEIKKLLEKGLLKLNDKIERFSSVKLDVKDKIKLLSRYKKHLINQDTTKIRTLYEDEYIIAIDKPINFVSSDENIHRIFPEEYTLIHRLDKDTSGVLLIAKNEENKEKIVKLFLNNKIEKEYIAIVDKKVNFNEKKIEFFLKKDKSIDGQTLYTVSSNGKRSLTYVKTLETKPDLSLVLLLPVTGRTHQLRVHLKKIGHPILGDYLYSKKFQYQGYVKRMLLHALKISFLNPFTNEEISIKSNIPEEFINYFEDIKTLI